MWNLKNDRELTYKTETDRLDLENKLLVTRGKDGGEGHIES